MSFTFFLGIFVVSLGSVAFTSGLYCSYDPDSRVPLENCTSNGTVYVIPVYFCGNITMINPQYTEEIQWAIPSITNYGIYSCSDLTGEWSGTCQEECTDPAGPQGVKCTGDSLFCANFTCSSSKFQCVCKNVELQSVFRVGEDGFWCNATDSLNMAVGVIAPPFQMNFSTSRDLLEMSGQTTPSMPLYISMSGDNLIINSAAVNLTNTQVVMVKTDWNLITPYTGGFLQIALPQLVFQTTGTLVVTVYINNSPYQSATFTVSGRSVCMVEDCILCESTWRNWRCLHTTQKLVVVVILMILLCLFFVACPAMVMILIWSIKCLLFPVRMCIGISKSMWRSKFKKDMQKKVGKIKSVKQYFFNEDKGDEEPATMRMNSSYAIIMLIGICCLSSVSAQCASGIFIPSSFLDCRLNGSMQTCNMTAALAATIQTVGASTCFSIYNSNNASDILLSGEVLFVSMQEKFNAAFQYYTMGWQGYQGSTKRCPVCSCESTYPDDVTGGHLTGADLLGYQGETICHKGCACAGCGCFYCSSSCIYSRYSIGWDNVGFGGVFSLTNGVKQPVVRVILKDSLQNVVADATFDGTTSGCLSQGCQIGLLSAQVVGSLASDVTPYLTNKIVVDFEQGYNYWFPASDANAPVAGSIGEIQSIDHTSMLNGQGLSGPEHNYMQVAAGLASPVFGSTSTNYNFQPSAYGKLALNPQARLPLYVAGNYWQISGFTQTGTNPTSVDVISQELTVGALLVSISTVQNISFSRTIDVVCPVVTFINATGCYSCEFGVTMVFSIYSTCSSGFVAVTTSNQNITVLTPAIVVNQTASRFVIQINTNQAHNDVCMVFTGNGGVATSCATFDASFYTPASPPGPPTNGTTVKQQGGCSFICQVGNFFKGMFNGIASWWHYVILIIILIIAIVLLVFTAPYIFMFFRFLFNGFKSSVSKIRNMRKKKSKEEPLPTSRPSEETPVTSGAGQTTTRRRIADIAKRQQSSTS